MRKKQASLGAVILLSIFIILSFMPIVFNEVYWEADTPGRGIYTQRWSFGLSMFACNGWLSIIAVAFAIVGIVALVMQYLGKTNAVSKYGIYTPIATIAIFALTSILVMSSEIPHGEPAGTATAGYYGFFRFAPAWGFFAECALLIIVSAICVMIVKEKFADEAPVMKKKTETCSPVEDLKKYKELLDGGVITQEEFDAKKKQLLGL